MSTRSVLIIADYGPVGRSVPGLSNDQNQLHWHGPFTLSTPGSSPCCCDRGLNISASSISICFILWQCNLKSQRMSQKTKQFTRCKKGHLNPPSGCRFENWFKISRNLILQIALNISERVKWDLERSGRCVYSRVR